MLKLGSRRYLSTFQKADAKLEEYFKYYATQASLRPWIYRPKNANTLLAMDLKEQGTDTPLKPRSPVKPLSKNVFNTYIWSAQEASQVLNLLHKWTSLTTRKRGIWGYFDAHHLQNILFASTFKFGKLSSFLKHLYMWKPKFAEAGNAKIYNVEHFFNSLVTCQLHRNAARELGDPELAYNKLLNAWNHVSSKEIETGLTSHLVAALAKQQGFSQTQLPGLSEVEIALPHANLESTSNGKLSAFLSDNRFLYVMAQTVIQYGNSTEALSSFVENYQSIAKKLGRSDIYQEYAATAKHLATEPKAPTTAAPHPAAEE